MLTCYSLLSNASTGPPWHLSPGLVDGVVMVTSDMSLSLVRYLDISTQYLHTVSTQYLHAVSIINTIVSVLLNLMVINALREKESLLARSHNLVLGNICCANLVTTLALGSTS